MATTTTIDQLTSEYLAAGFAPDQARAEAEREYRMTTGDCYAFRSDTELEAMREGEAEQIEQVRRTAGVSEEFPAGEFALPGYNTGGWSMLDRESDR